MKRLSAALLAILAIFSFSACNSTSSSGPVSSGSEGASSTSSSSPSSNSKGDILIGDIQDLTGTTSALGKMVEEGAQWAVDEINSKGGVDGRNVRLITYDTKGQVQAAINSFNYLVTSDQVSAIIGPPVSNIDIALAPISEKYNVPILQFAGDARAVVKDDGQPYKNMFLLQPSSEQEGYIMAAFGATTRGYKKFGVIYNQSNAYSVSLVQAFQNALKKINNGATIVETVPYQQNDKDFKTMLGKLTAADVDAIYAPNYIQELVLIAQQARAIGYNGPLICGLDANPPFASLAGPEANGVIYINNVDDGNSTIQSMVAAYKQKTGNDATVKFFLGYDAMNILADTIKKVGDDPAAIQKAISNLSGFEGTTGTISIDPSTHQTTGLSMYVDEVTDQKPKVITSFKED